MSKFGKRLRKLRKKKGLLQEELANKFNISQSSIANYELGKKEPGHDALQEFARFFNVSIDYLLGNTEDPRPVDQITEENVQRISEVLGENPDDSELLEFWDEMKERPDLFLLFKKVKPLDDEDIRRVIRIIKAIEDEEAQES